MVLCLSLQPKWKLADPVCTFLFSILVLISTINILKDTLRVLMEGKVGEKGGREGAIHTFLTLSPLHLSPFPRNS